MNKKVKITKITREVTVETITKTIGQKRKNEEISVDEEVIFFFFFVMY